MIPFGRRISAQKVIATMANQGLAARRGRPRIYVMCEDSGGVIQIDAFAEHFGDFSVAESAILYSPDASARTAGTPVRSTTTSAIRGEEMSQAGGRLRRKPSLRLDSAARRRRTIRRWLLTWSSSASIR
jgi:hypothetical protein